MGSLMRRKCICVVQNCPLVEKNWQRGFMEETGCTVNVLPFCTSCPQSFQDSLLEWLISSVRKQHLSRVNTKCTVSLIGRASRQVYQITGRHRVYEFC